MFLWFLQLWVASCSASNSPSIPVIDISSLYSPSPDNINERWQCATSIDNALRKFGTFMVTGHQLEGSRSSNAFQSAKILFDSSHKHHMMNIPVNQTSECMRGYNTYGSESGVGSTYFESKEGFSYGYSWASDDTNTAGDVTVELDGEGQRLEESHRQAGAGTRLLGQYPECPQNILQCHNQWPHHMSTQPADHNLSDPHGPHTPKEDLTKVFDETVVVSQLILRSLAPFIYELSRDPDDTTPMEDVLDCGDTISIMRLFHYITEPPTNTNGTTRVTNELGKEVLGSSPHTDWGFLTVILQDSRVGGLQFLYENDSDDNSDGNSEHSGGSKSPLWVDVPASGSTTAIPLVVNGGDYLSLLSKGRYKSPIHRVLIQHTTKGQPSSEPSGHEPSNLGEEASSSDDDTHTHSVEVDNTWTAKEVAKDIKTSISSVDSTIAWERFSFVLFFYPHFDTTFSTGENNSVSGSDVKRKRALLNGNYNTLAAAPAANHVDDAQQPSFGEYISSKWKGVQA